MSVLETVAVFVAGPLVVVLAVYAVVYAGGSRRARRYRPGRPFDFAPVWFLASAPESVDAAVTAPRAKAAVGRRLIELDSASAGAQAQRAAEPVPPATGRRGPKGGARGSW